MPKICYVEKNFRSTSLDLIEKVNAVMEEIADNWDEIYDTYA